MSLDEACEILSDFLNEADRQLKNEKKVHSTSGPENYSKISTENLKKDFEDRANMAKRSKLRRDESEGITSYGSDYGSHNRRKADDIAKELVKRGEKVKSPFYVKDENTREAVIKSRQKRDYTKDKPGAYTYDLDSFFNDPKPHAKGSSGSPGENRMTKEVIKQHLKDRGKLKEACLTILEALEYDEED